MQGLPELQIGPIAGGVASGVIVVCMILVVIFIRRRNLRNKEEGTRLELEGSSQDVNKHENGLVDNPVYETTGHMGPSTTKDIIVTHCAAVVKSKKKANFRDDPSNLYAQVDKTHKIGKEGGKNTNVDCKYENSRKGACDENVYENPGNMPSNKLQVNKDALFYADLMLNAPTTNNGKVVIRGIENRTEYAEIAFDKRGELLLDSEEEKGDGGGKKKIDE